MPVDNGDAEDSEVEVCPAMSFLAFGPCGLRSLQQRWLGYSPGERCPKGCALRGRQQAGSEQY